jgi:hypothetical protein
MIEYRIKYKLCIRAFEADRSTNISESVSGLFHSKSKCFFFFTNRQCIYCDQPFSTHNHMKINLLIQSYFDQIYINLI